MNEDQSLIEHLTELRTRLIYSLLGIALVTGGTLFFMEEIFFIIKKPILPYLPQQKLYFTGVMEPFLAHLKVGFFSGIILSCPWWVYQVWKFVEPGLFAREKKYAVGFIFFGVTLFLTGISFVYFVVYPRVYEFLLFFGDNTNEAIITLQEYLSFFVLTSLAFGLAFELPLVLTILGILGVVDKKFLAEKRRYAIVILATLSAVITPPDVMSMVFLVIPLILLYEISIFLVGFFEKRNEVATRAD